MKLPSIQHLLNASKETFFRFPTTIISAIAGSAIVIYMVEYSLEPNDVASLFRLMMTFILAVPLFTSGKLLIERNKSSQLHQAAIYTILLAILTTNYFLLPSDIDHPNGMDLYRYFLTGGAYGLTVTFAAYLVKNEVRGFWEFSKTLVIKLAATALYTGVLFAGIAIALVAIDYLLDVNINEDLYFEIWVFIAGVVAPWFFLSGYPQKIAALNKTKDYHKSVRIFGQYILVPLVVTYLVILYLYSGKILINNEWPVSEVTYLTICFALVGIATNLLLYPVRQDKSQSWSKWFEKGFFIALIPTLGMLFYAIWLRIEPYGLTENRYFVVILGLWLLAISLYQIFSKEKSIKTVIISFTAVILLSNYGPWSAYSISESSQINRLEKLLTTYEALDENGKATLAKITPPTADQLSINSIIDYLVDIHGVESLQPLFEENLKQLEEKQGRYMVANHLSTNILGLKESIPKYRTSHKYFYSDRNSGLSIQGFDYLYDLDLFIRDPRPKNTPYNIEITDEPVTIKVTQKDTNSTLTLPIRPLTQELESTEKANEWGAYDIPIEKMSIQKENAEMKVKVYFRSIDTNIDNGEIRPYNIQGQVLIDDKSNELNLETETETTPSPPQPQT